MVTLKHVLRRSRQERARQAAFADLHREHAVGVYNLALRLVGDREDAKDIAQEVLLKAYQQLGHQGELNQRAWLYRVTVNACYDHHRRSKRRPATSAELEYEPACVVDGYEQAELSRQLGHALHLLPPVQRTALILREVHGLRTEEVAEILGVQADSAAVTLSRARTSFRRHFSEIAAGEHVQPVGREAKPSAGLARAGSCGLAAVLGLHVPAVALPFSPLPRGLDLGSLVAAATASAASAAAGTVATATGAGAVAGALAKVGVALSTKAATVAIGATLLGGSVGGVYAAVERPHQAPSGASPAAAVASPASAASVAGPLVPAASSGTTVASPSATNAASASPSPLTVGESDDDTPSPSATSSPASPSSSPAAPSSSPAAPTPSPSAPSVAPTQQPEPSPTGSPSLFPTPSPSSPSPWLSPSPVLSPQPSAEPSPAPADTGLTTVLPDPSTLL